MSVWIRPKQKMPKTLKPSVFDGFFCAKTTPNSAELRRITPFCAELCRFGKVPFFLTVILRSKSNYSPKIKIMEKLNKYTGIAILVVLGIVVYVGYKNGWFSTEEKTS